MLKFGGLFFLSVCVSVLFFSSGPVSSSEIQEIQWHSYDSGMARGKFENMRIFLHFTADWCGYCRIMETRTFKDPGVVSALNDDFIAIKVDYDQERDTSNFYRVRGLPDTIFIDEDGKIIGRHHGYMTAAQLKSIINSILTMQSQK